MSLSKDALAGAMARIAGPGTLTGLARLSGGANMESWAFDWIDGDGTARAFVLRRAPSAAFMADRPFGHDDEAALVAAAHAAGVRAPEVVGVLTDADGLGTGYVMRRIDGRVEPRDIVAAPPPALLTDIGRELARIHAVPQDAIPASIPVMDVGLAINDLAERFAGHGGDRPVIALAIKWCRDHAPPAPETPVLVHGDFRIGNLIVGDAGLAAVLDWELAHRGDYHEDLAYGCMTVWRFGAIDRPAFGVGSIDALVAAYRAAGGAAVDPARFRFWLVYRTLWWAIGCLGMGASWRDGRDRNLERVVVARRTAEQELDLLRLIEDEAPEAAKAAPLPPKQVPCAVPTGEPSAAEIVTAVREWLEAQIKPAAAGRARFEVAVAINALGIAARDPGSAANFADRALADALLNGAATLAEPGLLARLRRQCLDKCALDSPKYPALAAARAAWNDAAGAAP